MIEPPTHAGGCLCARVRFAAHGEPLRRSLCHCLDCRKRHGAPMVAFAIYRREQVSVTGETASTVSDGVTTTTSAVALGEGSPAGAGAGSSPVQPPRASRSTSPMSGASLMTGS